MIELTTEFIYRSVDYLTMGLQSLV